MLYYIIKHSAITWFAIQDVRHDPISPRGVMETCTITTYPMRLVDQVVYHHPPHPMRCRDQVPYHHPLSNEVGGAGGVSPSSFQWDWWSKWCITTLPPMRLVDQAL